MPCHRSSGKVLLSSFVSNARTQFLSSGTESSTFHTIFLRSRRGLRYWNRWANKAGTVVWVTDAAFVKPVHFFLMATETLKELVYLLLVTAYSAASLSIQQSVLKGSIILVDTKLPGPNNHRIPSAAKTDCRYVKVLAGWILLFYESETMTEN